MKPILCIITNLLLIFISFSSWAMNPTVKIEPNKIAYNIQVIVHKEILKNDNLRFWIIIRPGLKKELPKKLLASFVLEKEGKMICRTSLELRKMGKEEAKTWPPHKEEDILIITPIYLGKEYVKYGKVYITNVGGATYWFKLNNPNIKELKEITPNEENSE